jgi:hypothetical protein
MARHRERLAGIDPTGEEPCLKKLSTPDSLKKKQRKPCSCYDRCSHDFFAPIEGGARFFNASVSEMNEIR